MKALVPVAALFFVACANDVRIIQTFQPEAPPGDAGSTTPDAGAWQDAGTEPVVDAGVPPNAQCSAGGWCRGALLPDGSPITTKHLRAVFARTATEVYAVGDNGTLLIFDGTGWRLPAGLRPADDLFAVWASGPNDVWVAGILGDPDQPQGMYAHFNGTEFDRFYKPLAKRPEGIFGFGPNDVWSVGTGGTIFRWTGMAATWQASPLITSESLTDVTGLGGKLWAVGSNGALLEHSGTAWVTMQTPSPAIPVGGLAAIVAFSPTRLIAAGGNDWLEFDGTQWTAKRWPLSLNVTLLGLWGQSPARLWGVGPSGAAWKFENGIGSSSDTGVTNLLRDIHGVDEQHVWAVGFDGTVLRRYGP